MKKIILACALMVSGSVFADEVVDAPLFKQGLSVQLPFHAEHFEKGEWNQNNWGVGLRYDFDYNFSVEAGTYHNSDFKQSEYAYVAWQPLKLTLGDYRVRVGAAFGTVNGYANYHKGNFGPAGAGLVSFEHKSGWALDLIVIPTTNAGSGCVGFMARVPTSF